jgi:hypothetical protein
MKKNLSLFKLSVALFVMLNLGCNKEFYSRIVKFSLNETTITGNNYSTSINITDIGPSEIKDYGIIYSVDKDLNLNDSLIRSGNKYTIGLNDFNFSNLICDTTYYYKAFLINQTDTFYTDIKEFRTKESGQIVLVNDYLNTLPNYSLKVKGGCLNIGSLKVEQFGHCWATIPNPTIAHNKTTIDSEFPKDGYFFNQLNNLSNQTVYYNSFAKIGNKYYYGDAKSINFSDPSVVTVGANNINNNKIQFTGNISSFGPYPLSEHGHCYSTTNSLPNYNDYKSTLGIPTNANFTSTIDPLGSSLLYYYRAYIVKDGQIFYGQVKTYFY